MYEELLRRPGVLLARIHTASLQQDDTPTRVLVALNPTEKPYSGLVRFSAAFPVRRIIGRRPVIVRALSGAVVPSRLTMDELSDALPLPPDRVIWRLEVEFLAAEVPAHGWRAFSSAFGASPESRSGDAAFWNAHSPFASEIQIIETECHDGDLPPVGHFSEISNFPFPL